MRFYLDEDISPKVAEILMCRKVDALSAHEAGMTGASDVEQLEFASAEKRVLVTRNRDDFIRIAVWRFEKIMEHPGILIVPHSIPGRNFSLLAILLTEFSRKHPTGLNPYTVDFLSSNV